MPSRPLSTTPILAVPAKSSEKKRTPAAPAAEPTAEILTAAEAAKILKVSGSFLAKARMRGDGPAFMKVGRAIRYALPALQQWMKSKQRLSTTEQ